MRMCILGLALLVGCTGEPPQEEEDTSLPLLRIAGSETATSMLVPRLGLSHSRSHASLRFRVDGGGSGEGMRAMLRGEADIAVTTRHHTGAEEEQARANGYSLSGDDTRHLIAVNVVGVATHPGNAIDALTYDQIIEVFCTGTIDNWAFLGLDDRPIRVLARDAHSGSRALFEDFFCGPRGMHSRIEERPVEQIRDILAEDPNVITFASLSEGAGRLLALRAEHQAPPALPSVQNVTRGAYPLYHNIYLYTPGPASGHAKDFIDWIASPAGQDVVDEARFVPLFLRTERMDEPRPLRETVHFEPGSSEPNQRSRTRLQLLTDELRQRAGGEGHVVLEGFTDNQEPNALRLSEERAVAVRDLLAAQLEGIFFEVIPRGAVNPLAPNTTPYGRQRNRRVQIYLADEEAGAEPSPPVEVVEAGD